MNRQLQSSHGTALDQPNSRLYSLVELCRISPCLEELDDDNLTIFDLENIILTGEITERQRDRTTREVKLVVRGISLEDIEAYCV